MRLPVIAGRIARRILANYRVDPAVMERLVPLPFRPRLIGGYALAGICLIRLEEVRPRGWPAWVGLASENAAHRVAVEWDVEGEVRQGVYVPRRDSSSWLNVMAGGRLFPGWQHHARFRAVETPEALRLEITGDEGLSILVAGRPAKDIAAGSVFSSLAAASQFFSEGGDGYSVTTIPGRYDGLQLRTESWNFQPFAVDEIVSSFFADEQQFPRGSVTFDSAYLMRNVPHEWHSLPTVCGGICGVTAPVR